MKWNLKIGEIYCLVMNTGMEPAPLSPPTRHHPHGMTGLCQGIGQFADMVLRTAVLKPFDEKQYFHPIQNRMSLLMLRLLLEK